VGHDTRNYVPAEDRPEAKFNIECSKTTYSKRNVVSNEVQKAQE
jgi:hypothetical protein